MLRALIPAGALAFGLAFTPVFAAGMHDGGDCARHTMKHDMGARMQQHLDRFKAELKLTPEQEPAWQAFAQAVTAQMHEMKSTWESARGRAMTAPERMQQRLHFAEQRVQGLREISHAFDNLYNALTPEQKAIADRHAAMMGPHAPTADRHHK